MKDLQGTAILLNEHKKITATINKDLLGEASIHVEFINLKDRNEHTEILDYVLDNFPEIFISHAYNGFSGNSFEYKTRCACKLDETTSDKVS